MSVFVKGRNARLTWNLSGSTVNMFVKNFRTKEIATEGVDDVCGEDRDRPFIVTGHYQVTFSAYNKDQSIWAAWLAMQAAEDAQVAELVSQLGVKYWFRNATTQKYMLTQCTRMPFDLNNESRTGSTMFDSGFNCRYLKPTQ